MQRAYTRSETLWQEMRGLLKKSPDTATRERMNLVADELNRPGFCRGPVV